MDLTNFRTSPDKEGTWNEAFREDEELEMFEKNIIRLLVSANDASQF